MSDARTKTVLGRVFTMYGDRWKTSARAGRVLELRQLEPHKWQALLFQRDGYHWIESGNGMTEANAILALQANLRQMAELEPA